MQCYRVSDGKTVPESEALDATGLRTGYNVRQEFVRPGDYLSFDLMMCDAAPAAQQMTDAQRAFASSPEGRSIVAYAKSVFDAGQAHKPEGERGTWTDEMANAVLHKRFAADAARSNPVADVESAALRAREHAAYQRSGDLNAWRRG